MMFSDVYDVCCLMTFVAYDVCLIMIFVAYDVCRIMTFVSFDIIVALHLSLMTYLSVSRKGFVAVPSSGTILRILLLSTIQVPSSGYHSKTPAVLPIPTIIALLLYHPFSCYCLKFGQYTCIYQSLIKFKFYSYEKLGFRRLIAFLCRRKHIIYWPWACV